MKNDASRRRISRTSSYSGYINDDGRTDRNNEEIENMVELVSNATDRDIPEKAVPVIRALFMSEPLADCPVEKTQFACFVDQMKSLKNAPRS